MYKVTFMLKFRKDITSEEARKEWLGSHGQLALTIPGLRRYVQNHWVAPAEGHEQVYDGGVDLYFDNEKAFKEGFSSPEGEAMLKDDLRIFDRGGKPAYVGGVVIEQVMRWEKGNDGR